MGKILTGRSAVDLARRLGLSVGIHADVGEEERTEVPWDVGAGVVARGREHAWRVWLYWELADHAVFSLSVDSRTSEQALWLLRSYPMRILAQVDSWFRYLAPASIRHNVARAAEAIACLDALRFQSDDFEDALMRAIFPARVLAARTLSSWSQIQLAQRLGVTRQTVIRWEGLGPYPQGPGRIAVDDWYRETVLAKLREGLRAL